MSAKKTSKTKTPADKAQKTAAPQGPKAEKAPGKAAKASAKPEKLSALDAAAKVLGESSEPMNCKEMIDAMAARGYWKSQGGQTPWATLYSAITREMATKGNEARFKKPTAASHAGVGRDLAQP